MSVSPTLEELCAVVKGMNVISMEEETFWVRFNMKTILENRNEIKFSAFQFYHLTLLREYIEKVFADISQKWNETISTFRNQFALLQDLLRSITTLSPFRKFSSIL